MKKKYTILLQMDLIHLLLFMCGAFAKENGLTGKKIGADPFSKVVIKSQKALLERDKDKKGFFFVKYSKDVHVLFADGTTITSDYLEATVCSKKEKHKNKKQDFSQIENIMFKGNVFIDRDSHKVHSDNVELIVKENLCKLNGHVKIKQVKKKVSGSKQVVPMVTKCDHAQLRWDTNEIVLEGNGEPVETVIELGGNLRFFGKKFVKKDQRKK